MNVGGLTGKEDKNGFWILMIVTSVLTIGWGISWREKNTMINTSSENHFALI